MRTFVAAVRLILFTITSLGIYLIWFAGNLVLPNRIYWRQVMFGLWARTFARISNMTIEVSGTPPKPPFFLVTNHLGYVDIAALRAIVTGVFVAKKEIEDWFIAGRIVGDMGTVFIDRTNRRDIPRAGEKILERLDAGEGVIVFPEGTSTKGEEVLPFNSSFLEFAARSDVPVSYAAISYRTPPGEMPASHSVCWWEDISFLTHIWRMFNLRSFTTVIRFGDQPVVNADRKELAAELHSRVAASFEPVT